MGSCGNVGERVARWPVELSKYAHCAQLISAPSLMSERAAERVGKAWFATECAHDG